MSLFQIFLCWVFFGFWASYIAKKRQKNPRFWFLMGLCLGLLGVIFVWILPSRVQRKTPISIKVKPLPQIDPKVLKMWFHLKEGGIQDGPHTYQAMEGFWRQGLLKPSTYVWGEGMEQWMRIEEIVELKEAFTSSIS